MRTNASIRRPGFGLGLALFAMFAASGCNDSLSATATGPSMSAGDVAGAPEACFTIAPDSAEITAGETVTLDASCSRNASEDASFAWALGDGRAETGRHLEVRYSRAGVYDVELTVSTEGGTARKVEELRVRPRPRACFTHEQLHDRPCTVSFDATCSAGGVVEYEWFFEGGPRPPISLPDRTITTEEPTIVYSWDEDEECFAFRPFERTVRLTVHGEGGETAEVEDVIVFGAPLLKR